MLQVFKKKMGDIISNNKKIVVGVVVFFVIMIIGALIIESSKKPTDSNLRTFAKYYMAFMFASICGVVSLTFYK